MPHLPVVFDKDEQEQRSSDYGADDTHRYTSGACDFSYSIREYQEQCSEECAARQEITVVGTYEHPCDVGSD